MEIIYGDLSTRYSCAIVRGIYVVSTYMHRDIQARKIARKNLIIFLQARRIRAARYFLIFHVEDWHSL